MKLFLCFIIILLLLVILFIIICYYYISWKARGKCVNIIEELPAKEYALILGAAKWVKQHSENAYFKYRIIAATELYQAEKIKKLIVSGSSGKRKENEPADMRAALIENGVAASDIEMDMAGYRTLDSIVRCRDVWQQKNIIIVSQHFHNERAIFIGLKLKMEVIAFNAPDVKGNAHIRMQLREFLARVKCILDLYLLHSDLFI